MESSSLELEAIWEHKKNTPSMKPKEMNQKEMNRMFKKVMFSLKQHKT